MNYQPTIIRKNGSFCVYLPELKVAGTGATISEAYAQFECNLQAEEVRNAEFGLNALHSEPYPALKKGNLRQELMIFGAKVAVSAFSIILVILLVLPNISAAIRHNIREAIPAELRDPRYWALQFPEQINARLDRLKPEEEAQINREWGKLLGRTSSIFGTDDSCAKGVKKH